MTGQPVSQSSHWDPRAMCSQWGQPGTPWCGSAATLLWGKPGVGDTIEGTAAPWPAAVSHRGGCSLQRLIALWFLLTWAAGNKDIHFYFMEIPEDLQMVKIMSGKRDEQPSGCPSPAPPLIPYVLQDFDGDCVHKVDGAEVQDDSMEVRLGQSQGAQGGFSRCAALLSTQLNHRNAWPIALSLCVLWEDPFTTWVLGALCRAVSPQDPGFVLPYCALGFGGALVVLWWWMCQKQALCSHSSPASKFFPGHLVGSPQ